MQAVDAHGLLVDVRLEPVVEHAVAAAHRPLAERVDEGRTRREVPLVVECVCTSWRRPRLTLMFLRQTEVVLNDTSRRRIASSSTSGSPTRRV